MNQKHTDSILPNLPVGSETKGTTARRHIPQGLCRSPNLQEPSDPVCTGFCPPELRSPRKDPAGGVLPNGRGNGRDNLGTFTTGQDLCASQLLSTEPLRIETHFMSPEGQESAEAGDTKRIGAHPSSPKDRLC